MRAIREAIQLAYKFYSTNDSKLKQEIKRQLALKMAEINLHKLKFIKKQESECYSLFVNEKIIFCYFYMKQGHLMPLHDHPKMTVFFKVMRGRILLSQYQVINQETKKYKKISRILEGPSEMIVLEEGSWTMHKFLILSEEAVVLDIIGPPYDDYERKCSYFQDQSEIPGNETVTIPERAIKVSSDQNVFSKDNSTKDPASRSQSTLVLGDHQSNSDLNPIVSNQLHSLNSHHNSVSKTIDVLSETKQVAESKFDLGFETFQLPNGVVIPLDICELVQLKVVDIEYHSDTSVFDVFASD